ncbi:nuclear transport factor 2 family protein [Devosia sp.]|uniref:nuclear transport factor 2 family protein n=1 Tax=Devosia sp. TaxID=1871048 RepID=UPI002FC9D9A4
MTLKTPLQCVELQFEAYNQRDLPRFLTAFADNVRSFRLPDMTLMIDGKAAYGEFYASQRFSHAGLRAELLNRMVIGNKVIDHELIHGLGPEPIETAVMFVVEEGLITTVFAIPAKSPL